MNSNKAHIVLSLYLWPDLKHLTSAFASPAKRSAKINIFYCSFKKLFHATGYDKPVRPEVKNSASLSLGVNR